MFPRNIHPGSQHVESPFAALPASIVKPISVPLVTFAATVTEAETGSLMVVTAAPLADSIVRFLLISMLRYRCRRRP